MGPWGNGRPSSKRPVGRDSQRSLEEEEPEREPPGEVGEKPGEGREPCAGGEGSEREEARAAKS